MRVGFLLAWLIFSAVVGGGVGFAIGNAKGRAAAGFWLGFLLGFIGWIIVAVMEPSPEVQKERAAALAAAIGDGMVVATRVDSSATRPCPYCAESIRCAAVVCRFCGRDVEPLVTDSPQAAAARAFDAVRLEFPNQHEIAASYLAGLPEPPSHPDRWLRELCKRMSAGSPPQAAAGRIPLDWNGPPSPDARPPERLATDVRLGDAAAAGSYEAVARDYPDSYDIGRTLLAGLNEPPDNPGAWLRELCKRIDAGSPPQAAALRIPLTFGSG